MLWKMGPGRADALPCWTGALEAVGTSLFVTFMAKAFTLGQLICFRDSPHSAQGTVGSPWAGALVVVCAREMFPEGWTLPRVQSPWSHATAASMHTSPPDFLPPAWPRPHQPAAATTGHMGCGSEEHTGGKEPGPVGVSDAHSLTW